MDKNKPKKKDKKAEIILPEKDIKVEPGQLSFLPALQKVVKTKKK